MSGIRGNYCATCDKHLVHCECGAAPSSPVADDGHQAAAQISVESAGTRMDAGSQPLFGAGGDSVDTFEFRVLLADVCAAYNSGLSVAKREREFIAHIDAWAARRAAPQPPKEKS